MYALLRFLYDIPYGSGTNKSWTTTLKPHAQVYVVAEKYRIEALKSQIHTKMQGILKSVEYLKTERVDDDGMTERLKNKGDFIDALRIIYTAPLPTTSKAGSSCAIPSSRTSMC